MSINYIVISPVRNGAQFIEATISSMLKQTIRPRQWIIVDDGSTDATFEIVKSYARQHEFIDLVGKTDRRQTGFSAAFPEAYNDRVAAGSVPKAFNFGVKLINAPAFDFIVKLDGDLSFEADYFERIFEKFTDDPKLGIAGGHCYERVNGKLKMEKVPDSHVRGATKIYRKQCWLDIGGLQEVLGWDTIDELKAQLKGWVTRSFAEPKLVHLRPTASTGGILVGRARAGKGSYFLGYHPLYILVRALRQMGSKPYFIGGMAMLWGFYSSYLRRSERYGEKELREYLRHQQLGRILRPMNLRGGRW